MYHRLFTINLITVALLTMTMLTASLSAAAMILEHKIIRQDRYTIPYDEFQWGEGWGEIRQFFPRYYKSAGAVHLFIRNTADKPITLSNLTFNHQPVADVCTRPDYAGPVIWYRVFPQTLQPGQSSMIILRLRDMPTDPVHISLQNDQNQTLQTTIAPDALDTIRFGFVGFNKTIDTLYAYVENWSPQSQKLTNLELDGRDITAQARFINPSFKVGPALIVVPLDAPLTYGSYHDLRVTTKQGLHAMYQCRARDNRFYLGLCQGQTPLKEYWAKFFNTLYNLHGSHPTEPNWWDDSSELAQLGFTIIKPGPTVEAAQAGATVPPGRIIYNGVDEPDAHEPPGLPYMQRSGINAMRTVEPPMVIQRRHDPYHDTMILVDRTYAPLNWFNYGELPDILMQDCYPPTRWMGFDLEVAHYQTRAVTQAAAPRPAHIMLWGCMNTGYSTRRAPTPQENDMLTHYVIAEGAKGLFYFLDWNSYPRLFEGGYYIGAPRCNMLWKQMGRVNAEISRISDLLAIGHPYQIASSDNDKLYVRSLLCGPDEFVIVLVNTQHRIHISDRFTRTPHVFPIQNANITIDPPAWFKAKKLLHVTYDGVKSLNPQHHWLSDKITLPVNDLWTTMTIVLSSRDDIADHLTLPAEQYQALLESERPQFVTDGPVIPDTDNPQAVIHLDESLLAQNQITLDLTQRETLSQAARIETQGTLKLNPNHWLGLFTPKDTHGQAVIEYVFESDQPLSQVTANLLSQTPNFTACADNVIGLSTDRLKYTQDSSFKMEWNGGVSGELLTAQLTPDDNDPLRKFYLRIMLRDPGIVFSDNATNLAHSVQIQWTTANDQ